MHQEPGTVCRTARGCTQWKLRVHFHYYQPEIMYSPPS